MAEDKLTPDYIVSQIGLLSPEEIKDLIAEYGSQQAEEASYWAEKNIR